MVYRWSAIPTSSSGMITCWLLKREPLTVVPLVEPMSRTCQTPLISLKVQCLPETFSKSSRISQLPLRPTTISGLSSGIGSPPPTGIKVPSFSFSGGMGHSSEESAGVG